jgi:hypothetical protein
MRVIAAVRAVFTGLLPLAEDDAVAALCRCKTFAWLAEVRAEVVIVGLHLTKLTRNIAAQRPD